MCDHVIPLQQSQADSAGPARPSSASKGFSWASWTLPKKKDNAAKNNASQGKGEPRNVNATQEGWSGDFQITPLLAHILRVLKFPGDYHVCLCGGRMAHRIWKETKQQPVTAGPGNMLDIAYFISIFCGP